MNMFNKLYTNTKKYIKENIVFLLIIVGYLLFVNVRLPFSIESPGGLININERLSGALYKSKGSINLTYVTVRKGTLPNLFIALLNNNWDIISNETITLDNETMKESLIRSRLDYDASVNSSYYVAYRHAEFNPQILDNNIYVEYILDEAKTNLSVGDKILKFNNQKMNNLAEFNNYIQTLEVGDKIVFLVENDGSQYKRTANVIDYEGTKMIGITIINIPDIDVKQKITYKGEDNENGPSGGLMFTLAIYNAITEVDITKGYKISGTGTIDLDGKVGKISGVKYKLAGAVNKHADIFIAPSENYEEALKIKKENNYDIKIIKADTFNEALEELKKLK